MIYGYARVSTAAQDHAGQVAQLTAAGCDQVVTEKLSAAAGRQRPQLVRLVKQLQAGDVLMVVKLNRLARSARDALNIIHALLVKGAGFRSMGEPWADTTTPAGRFLVTVFVGLAEFDREMILERTAEGRVNAKARGVRLGRTPTLTRDQAAFVVKARTERPRIPISQLQALLKVSRSTICRAARAGEAGLTAFPTTPAGGQLDIEEVTGARPPAAA